MIDLARKRIFIAGGSGFIGSHLRAALLQKGVPPAQISAPGSNECDLRVWPQCLAAMKGAEIVFDCAAVPGDLVLRSKMPGKLFYENLILGIHLTAAAFQSGAQKIITIGSATEYPAAAPAPLSEENLWDGLPTSGNIPYGLSKRIAALQGELYRREAGFNAIHVLLTNTYGPGERYASGYMVPSLIQKILMAQARGESSIEVWGTGQAIRDLIFVEDAMAGIIAAAEKYDEGTPLNIASGSGISIRELVALLCSLAGYAGEVRWDETKPEGDLKRLLNPRRAEEIIGFRAATPLADGLRQTIAWHRHEGK